MTKFGTLALVSVLFNSLSHLALGGQLRNWEKYRAHFGINRYDSLPGIKENLKKLKIAIIGRGFGDLATLAEDMPMLRTTVVPTMPNRDALTNETHDREMAHIVWAMTGKSDTDTPQFYLLNGNFLPNFTDAVDYCVANKIDIILHAGNWEYGGNFDGRGFINSVVSRATNAGILWVNAAGNYGKLVHNAEVRVTDSGYLDLGANGKGLRLDSHLDDTLIQVTLSWNSYSEQEEVGTQKDLDLFIEDSKGKIVASQELRQREKNGVERKEGESFLPREIVEATLKEGTYFIRVKAHGGTFTRADKLRITFASLGEPIENPQTRKLTPAVEFPEATPNAEIMVPADHPGVITVGDLGPYSSIGPTADGRQKPDFVLDRSDAVFSNKGLEKGGTSSAAAYFAGILAMLKAKDPALTRDGVMKLVAQNQPPPVFAKVGQPRDHFEEVRIEDAKELHPEVFETITRMTGREPVSAVNHSDGHMGLGISKPPKELIDLFPGLRLIRTHREYLEFYVVETRDKNDKIVPLGILRSRLPDQWGRYQPYPWKERASSPSAYVELREVETPRPPAPIWQTPAVRTPEDENAYTRENWLRKRELK